MGFNFHAEGTSDPPEVRNWKIHVIAVIASMSAIASKLNRRSSFHFLDHAHHPQWDMIIP
jgi:hypothetical protein